MTDNAELKGLMDEATGLTWHPISAKRLADILRAGVAATPPYPREGTDFDKDAALIVAAVNELPRLLADSEALAAEREKVARMREALKRAEEFIQNGVEYGYIRMPDTNSGDSAPQALPAIRAALRPEADHD